MNTAVEDMTIENVSYCWRSRCTKNRGLCIWGGMEVFTGIYDKHWMRRHDMVVCDMKDDLGFFMKIFVMMDDELVKIDV